MSQSNGEQSNEATALIELACNDLEEGNYEQARNHLKQSLEISQASGDQEAEAATWYQLAIIDLEEENNEHGREKLKRSVELNQAIGNKEAEAAIWHGIASIDIDEGDLEGARANFTKALEMRQEIGDAEGEAATVGQIAWIAWQTGQQQEAIRMASVVYGLLAAAESEDLEVAEENLTGMASELGLSQEAFEQILEEGIEIYKNDRCAALIAEVFDAIEIEEE